MDRKLDLNQLIKWLLIIGAVIYIVHTIKSTIVELPQDLEADKQKFEEVIDNSKKTVDKYEERKSERIKNINKTNNDKVKEINNIPNLNAVERDSLWTILLNSKDSIPRRYWDILESKSRRKSSGSF
jgi:hypothetical protein